MNKKLKFLIISIASLVLNLGIYFSGLELSVWIIILCTLLYTVVSLFFIKRSYSVIVEVRKKLIFLGMFLFIQGLFLNFFPQLGGISILFYAGSLALQIYILMLASNVFIVSENMNEEIPLIEPSKVVMFIAYLLNVFLGSTIIYKIHFFPGNQILDMVINFILFGIFFYANLYTLDWIFRAYRVGEKENRELTQIGVVASIIILLFLTYSLTLYPFETFASALVISASFYGCVNFIINYLLHKINLRFYIETILMIFIAFITAVLI